MAARKAKRAGAKKKTARKAKRAGAKKTGRRRQNAAQAAAAKRNLAPAWKPGQSGNPAGRPPRKTFEAIVSEVLDELAPGSDKTKREIVARVFAQELMRGHAQLIKEFLAREWPTVERVEAHVGVSSDDEVRDELLRRLRAVAEPGTET